MHGHFRIADPLDLALMKVIAIASRGAKRDFFDLALLLRELMPLWELLEWIPKKYGEEAYNIAHLLRSLAYFEDADAEPDPVMLSGDTWPQVKRFIAEQTQKTADRLLN